MNYIKTTQLWVLWNSQRMNTFKLERGLSQGDLLSPYLFVLYMETLHHKIAKAMYEKKWKPCELKRNGPKISHLFFADDLLLLREASVRQAELMEEILQIFCNEIGKK